MKSQALKSYSLVSPFAGTQYPDSSKEAFEFFENILRESPPSRPAPSASTPTLIVPHIDFRVNQALYGTAYQRLLTAKKWPEIFIILGVGHRCPYEVASLPLDYQTIFGPCETDLPLWTHFRENCEFDLDRSPSSFQGEHSLEFVVIWLKALQAIRGKKEPFRILPILLGGLQDEVNGGQQPSPQGEFGKLCTAFQALLEETKGRSQIIASIDGCHVGPRFQHPFPANEEVQNAVIQWEQELWAFCSSPQYDAFFEHLAKIKNGFYFDGVGVLSLLLKTLSARAQIDGTTLWQEESDQSLVTFSAGCLIPEKKKS